MSVDDKLVALFSSLYRGRTDAWGSVEGLCNKKPVTEANYRLHLEAKVSLGVYMLLDDGTCNFAAVDIDEKAFDKALAIKNELKTRGISAYISASKGKGYHVSIYAETKFNASDIRKILADVIKKLGMNPKTEIFPKQDKLDPKIPYGNYINLPCFGYDRPYMTDDQQNLIPSKALSLIKRVPESVIAAAIQALPVSTTTTTAAKNPEPSKTGNKRGPRPKHPPCIMQILQGVQQGARDEAAFALARHYLDTQYTEDEVLALLIKWDEKNKPPFADEKQLETKLKSAQKGYAFGCSSIKNGVLSGYCVGEEKCVWLQENIKDKKKKGLLKDTTFFETPTHLFEEVAKGTDALFLSYEKDTGIVNKTQQIEIGEITYVPVMSQEITEGAVLLPNGIEEYGDTLDLVAKIRAHIHRFVDIPPTKEEFAAWYILMTWVSDRLRTVGYYRFEGDTGTGKSRALDVVGRLCYKPMVLAGAITPAPIYRLIRRFRGTLVLDEADFSDSSEKSEVVTILNCGFEKGRPIVRCSKDDPNTLEILPCFGPKVFATRYTFDDVALEARCITTKMEETDRDDILSILDDTFFEEEMSIRNQLLLWRMHNYLKIEYNAIRDIDLGKLEPRMKQTTLPYALMFKEMPEVMERFRTFIHGYQNELIETRSEGEQGRIVYSLLALAAENGKNYVSSGMITAYVNEHFKLDITSQKVGKILHSLNLTTVKKRYQGKHAHYIQWAPATLKKIYRRYTVDPTEFEALFNESQAQNLPYSDNDNNEQPIDDVEV
ncbi:MAG: primase C-terminal domain-containing protein [Candidatus Marinimicrobia bacterium]|jgi:hypothetical protein|nr:primase C-terminal domain-containing protein [Candidatus Neomarinimicrobiota bacterium]